ncbi:flagellar motor switch phosphatase FliY [Aureibacillus halotolerans]|uniref:Flagellar motor switch protein FliN/FliY n=1 Tax=Aureibacillus halotolerans TaxID=1508390 RepID=A0A4V3D5D7_9BACI|nr:flagellar motor switch phosphatase FliY [Aureibacillus halotolerans]TDQ39657.1 flagellar motor switch protein FliN/FliY [Aureibacillus halotolerans]
MSNMLSQDEIDALLKGTAPAEDTTSPELSLSEVESDAMGEIANISFGSSATALSALLQQKVEITTPTVRVIQREELQEAFPRPYVAIVVSYTEGFVGHNVFVMETRDAMIIANLMLGGDGTDPGEELGELEKSAVQEAMNQMMGSAATSMSTVFHKKVDISPPSVEVWDFKNEDFKSIPEDPTIAQVSFRLKVGELIDSALMQLVPIDFSKDLVAELFRINKEDNQSAPAQETLTPPTVEAPRQQMVQSSQSSSQPAPTASKAAPKAQEVQPAIFSSFDEIEQPHHVDSANIGMLLDIPLQVTVELGRTKRKVQDILDLASGSIIELDKLAGEPVDILINQKKVAKGEVVVIDENFGVRVTDIISQNDRIKKLQ